MGDEAKDYGVGYGKPPLETRFRKGQSGNPGGRRRGSKTLAALLGEALSRRSGFANPDGSWMTQAEAVFATLVGQAAGADLKAKRLLFDLVIKLQRSPMCAPQDRLPEIELDASEDAGATVAAEVERIAEGMSRDLAARARAAATAPPSSDPPDGQDPVTPSRTA